MRHWSHGHSIAAGVIVTMLAERHTLLFAVLLFAAGAATMYTIVKVRSGGRRVATGAGELVRARLETERARRDEVRARRRLKLEQARSLRRVVDERVRHAYYEGAADAGKP